MDVSRQFEDIQRLGKLGCWQWEVEPDRVTWSEGLFRIYDLEPADFEPTFDAYLARVHEEDRERVALLLRTALESDSTFEFEERIHRPDGSIRVLRSAGQVERSADGSPLRLTGVCHDVTALRAAEEAALLLAAERAARGEAEQSARRQRFLAGATAELARSLDYEETLRAVARMAVPEIADWCAVDLVDHRGELRRIAVEHSDPARIALAHELARRYPHERGATRGPWRVMATGEPDLLEDIPDALIEQSARDADHVRLLRTLGLKSSLVVPLGTASRTLGTVTFVQAESGRRFDHDDIPLLQDLAGRAAVAIDNAHTVSDLDAARQSLGDQAVELEAQAAELEAQTEELQQMMTELEHRNEELQQRSRDADEARAVAEAANRAKSQFLATMSHELRTPLNAIAGYTQLLELGIHGPVNTQQLDTLARIQRNQHRLLSVINDVLNFTRIDAGRLPVDITLVRVADLLANMEALIAPQVRTRGLMLQIARPADSLLIRADAERAEQVLLNLLSNAVKFTAPGGRIEVTCDTRGAAVRIHVADTGRGIPSDRLEAIFDPFVQIDPQLTRETDGIGLGLSISRELARAMSGDITVRSVPERGSMFSLLLPAATADAVIAPTLTSH